MFVTAKKFFWSRTIWLGLAALAIPFFEGVVDLIELNEGGYEKVVYGLGVLIIFLRSITTKPITFTSETKKYVED